jgi:hypothetical protein
LEKENGGDHFGVLCVDERKILKYAFNIGIMLIGFMWLTTDPSVGLL